MSSTIIIILSLAIFFFWGFLSAIYKKFPFSIIRNIYWNFVSKDIPYDKDKKRIFYIIRDIYLTFINKDIPYDKDKKRVSYIKKFYNDKKLINYQEKIINEKLNNIKKNSNLIRKKIIDKYILPDELINFNKLEMEKILSKKVHIDARQHQFKNNPSADSILLNIKYYNINHYGILGTNKKNKKLLIYHEGHDGNPYNSKNFLDFKEKFKTKGYDILSLSMTGLGYNMLLNPNYSFPINPEKNSDVSFNYQFHNRELKCHDIYQFYFDKDYPNIMPLALMLSGNYYIIKNLEDNYDEIVMMGISGGGWHTTMFAALLPKIQKSYSFSGTFPKFFKLDKNTRTEWEDTYSKIYDEYDYWDFYFLALFDSENFHNREHNLIFNSKDPYSYNDPWATAFKNLVDLISIDNLRVIVLDKDRHEINIEFVDEFILKKLD